MMGLRFRVGLMEFLAAVMGDHVGSYLRSREEFLARHGISREQLNAMQRACRRGRFTVWGRQDGER
jgi:hypothetical protein